MKEIVKEHPLRPIILSFDPNKKALDFEVKALEAYYRMHDRSYETKRKLLQHKEALFDIDVKTCELEYLLQPIAQDLDFLESAFKLGEKKELPLIEEPFTIKMETFYEDVDNLIHELNELNKQVATELDWFNAWADYIYDHENWFDDQDAAGDKLIHKVFRHYDEVSVDIVALDRDQQEFLGVVGEIRKLQRDYFDYGEVVAEQYTRVHHEIEAIGQRALRVQQYMDKHYPQP